MAVYQEKRKGKATGTWIAEIQIDKVCHRERFETKKEADAWYGVAKATKKPPVKALAERPEHSFGAVAKEARQNRKAWKRTQDTGLEQRLSYVVDFLGEGTDLEAISTQDFDRLVKTLERKPGQKPGTTLSPKTINRYLAVISAVFDYARSRNYTKSNPHIPWQEEGEGKIVVITPQQEATIIAHVANAQRRPDIALCFRVLVQTGMRAGEMFGTDPTPSHPGRPPLQTEQIESEWIRLWDTKTHRPRSAPIDPVLSRQLRTLVVQGRLPNTAQCWRAMKAACESAGYSDELTVHTWRHTTASRLAELGVPAQVIKEYLGHSSIATTMKYIHMHSSTLTNARKLLSPAAGLLVSEDGMLQVPQSLKQSSQDAVETEETPMFSFVDKSA